MLRPGENEILPVRRTLLLTHEDVTGAQQQGMDADSMEVKTRSSVRRGFWERFFGYRNLSRAEFQDLASLPVSAPEISTRSRAGSEFPSQPSSPEHRSTDDKSTAAEILAQIEKTERKAGRNSTGHSKADDARLFAALVKAGVPSAAARTSIEEHHASHARQAAAPTPTT